MESQESIVEVMKDPVEGVAVAEVMGAGEVRVVMQAAQSGIA